LLNELRSMNDLRVSHASFTLTKVYAFYVPEGQITIVAVPLIFCTIELRDLSFDDVYRFI